MATDQRVPMMRQEEFTRNNWVAEVTNSPTQSSSSAEQSPTSEQQTRYRFPPITSTNVINNVRYEPVLGGSASRALGLLITHYDDSGSFVQLYQSPSSKPKMAESGPFLVKQDSSAGLILKVVPNVIQSVTVQQSPCFDTYSLNSLDDYKTQLEEGNMAITTARATLVQPFPPQPHYYTVIQSPKDIHRNPHPLQPELQPVDPESPELQSLQSFAQTFKAKHVKQGNAQSQFGAALAESRCTDFTQTTRCEIVFNNGYSTIMNNSMMVHCQMTSQQPAVSSHDHYVTDCQEVLTPTHKNSVVLPSTNTVNHSICHYFSSANEVAS